MLSRAGFDLAAVSPISHVASSFVPALFGAGRSDALISPKHAERLAAAYAGDHNLVMFDGDHNTPRPPFFYASAAIFLGAALHTAQESGTSALEAPAPHHANTATGASGGH